MSIPAPPVRDAFKWTHQRPALTREKQMLYAMMINGFEGEWEALSEAETAAAMEKIGAWVSKWQAAGKMVEGGGELGSVRDAKTIRLGADGKPVVTDGPYLELKEVLGGFIRLDTDDIDEAVAIAATWPNYGWSSIEVRPILQ
jgi:hypothetical protein